jgi:type VI secretion system secreted protein VgrG
MLGLRTIEVVSPVGGTDIVVESMTGDEALGRPFEFTVDLLSTKGDLVIEDAVGKHLTVVLDLGDQPPRQFDGVVIRFAQIAWTGDRFRYRATLRPWLSLLARASNSRIFQNKTIPEILAAIFDAHGYSGDVDDSQLDHGSYKPHEYLVQYNETDLNFVSRLMEHAGISYHFKHSAGQHTLVLSDGPLTEKVPGYATIPYFSGDSGGVDALGHEHVSAWSVAMQVASAAFAAKEFDFQNPKAPLLSVLNQPKPGAASSLELFEYPGQYIDDNLRQSYVARRLEGQQLGYEISQGTANARAIRPGICFSLTEYPWDAQNREYLVTSASYLLTSSQHSSGGVEAPQDFVCTFFAIDSKRTYRTPAITPKPRVAGPQTAIVVGPKGEEIWTDKFGRVKVQFHWDRVGKSDENSSCWIRASQLWAGPKWGGIHIPRIGQEVVVDFLEGDPDRPLITGRVYNNDNMPPYDLPANRTQSGIKSRSALNGTPSNFNELRFEDKKGSELVYGQAEKDLQTLVKNDESRDVGHDRSTTIGHDQTLHVKNDETTTIDGNRTETVTKNESITISGARTESVAKDESISIGGSRSETVAKSESVSVGGARSLSVAKDDATSVDGAQTLEVAKDQSITVSGGRTANISKDDSATIGGALSLAVSKDGALQIGKALVIDVADEITIKTGDATITMKKNGDITIKGKNITLDASGKANVKAASDITIKGSKISQN